MCPATRVHNNTPKGNLVAKRSSPAAQIFATRVLPGAIHGVPLLPGPADRIIRPAGLIRGVTLPHVPLLLPTEVVAEAQEAILLQDQEEAAAGAPVLQGQEVLQGVQEEADANP